MTAEKKEKLLRAAAEAGQFEETKNDINAMVGSAEFRWP